MASIDQAEELRLYLQREVEPFLLRALTDLLLHQPRDARAALSRYVAWRQEQRRAHTEAFAAAAGGLGYEGDAWPAWLEGLELVAGGDMDTYAALRVAPVLRALVRRVVAGAGEKPPASLPEGEAVEEAIASFLESWDGQEEEKEMKTGVVLLGDVTLLFVGLGGAGKTSVIAALQGEADSEPAPTTGFNPHTAVLAGDGQQQRLLHLHDVGGAEAIRGIWLSYYHDAHGVVWVTACTDLEAWRSVEAPVLRECLAHPFLAGKPLLVLLNRKAPPAEDTNLLSVEALRMELQQAVPLLRVEECIARAPAPAAAPDGPATIDARIEAGVAWLVAAVGEEGAALLDRMAGDTAAAEAALVAARARKDRELLRALLDSAAGAKAGEEGVLSKEEALTFLADALETTDTNAVPTPAVALAERVGFHRAGLQLLIEMLRRAGDWGAVVGLVEEAAGAVVTGAWEDEGGVDGKE